MNEGRVAPLPIRLARAVYSRLKRRGVLRFDRATVFVRDTPNPPEGDDPPGLSVRTEGAEAIAEMLSWGLEDAAEYERRLERGEALWMARIGGAPAGFLWVGYGTWDSHWLEHSFPLEGGIWIHDVFVDATHRRKGVYSAMLRRVLPWAAGKGHARAYCLVLHSNTASTRAHLRNGFVSCEEVVYRRVLCLARQRIRGVRGPGAMTRLGPLIWRRGPAGLAAASASGARTTPAS